MSGIVLLLAILSPPQEPCLERAEHGFSGTFRPGLWSFVLVKVASPKDSEGVVRLVLPRSLSFERPFQLRAGQSSWVLVPFVTEEDEAVGVVLLCSGKEVGRRSIPLRKATPQEIFMVRQGELEVQAKKDSQARTIYLRSLDFSWFPRASVLLEGCHFLEGAPSERGWAAYRMRGGQLGEGLDLNPAGIEPQDRRGAQSLAFLYGQPRIPRSEAIRASSLILLYLGAILAIGLSWVLHSRRPTSVLFAFAILSGLACLVEYHTVRTHRLECITRAARLTSPPCRVQLHQIRAVQPGTYALYFESPVKLFGEIGPAAVALFDNSGGMYVRGLELPSQSLLEGIEVADVEPLAAPDPLPFPAGSVPEGLRLLLPGLAPARILSAAGGGAVSPRTSGPMEVLSSSADLIVPETAPSP
jgi:hypothetical protein